MCILNDLNFNSLKELSNFYSLKMIVIHYNDTYSIDKLNYNF